MVDAVKNVNSINELAFSGAKWSFALNLVQKLLSFSLNQALFLYVTPAVFGVAAIQLELILSSLLFLSREGIRLATLRQVIVSKVDRQLQINISWIPCAIIVAIIVTIVSYNYLCYRSTNNSKGNDNIDVLVVVMYCIGALLESIGEPWINMSQNAMNMSLKVQGETVAILSRSIATFIAVAYYQLGVYGFGIAQIVYGTTYLLTVVYRYHCLYRTCTLSGNTIDFFPRTVEQIDNVDNVPIVFRCINYNTFKLACGMTLSSLLKHLLTEADKITLSLTATSYDQGVFALASNYGSLAARLVFLPLEDACRLVFSKLSAQVACSKHATKEGSDHNSNIAAISDMLCNVLRFLIVVVAIIPAIGPNYIPLIVQLLFSKRWQSEEFISTLSSYCYYLFLLAINGVSEAYVQSVVADNSFLRVNAGFVCSTATYVTIVIPLVKSYKASGLVIASSLAMLVRILSNMLYIKSTIESRRGFKVASVLPSVSIFLCLLMVMSCTFWSSLRYSSNLATGVGGIGIIQHVSLGIILVVLYLLLVYYERKRDILYIVNTLSRKNKSD